MVQQLVGGGGGKRKGEKKEGKGERKGEGGRRAKDQRGKERRESNLTHGSVFTKQHVCGHVDTEIEDIHVVLDGHLQLSEGRHLHDQTSRGDGE